jgi:hypothetical protein
MSSSSDQDWQAAIAAWNGLSAGQLRVAIGYIASKNADLVTEAAHAASLPPHRDIGMEARALDDAAAREVLLLLCDRLPAVIAEAIDIIAGA